MVTNLVISLYFLKLRRVYLLISGGKGTAKLGYGKRINHKWSVYFPYILWGKSPLDLVESWVFATYYE